MKQPSCHKAVPRLSEAEAYLSAVKYGHLHPCGLSGAGNPADILARLSVPSVTRIQTGIPASAMFTNQPETERP